MAHKTFISYRYSESRDLRDKIIGALGKDATYYRGENVDSKDMSDNKRKTIKDRLSDMMYDTSVTIVILSPDMRKSELYKQKAIIIYKIVYYQSQSDARRGRQFILN